MPGFTAHLADVMGEVTTDWYGNPLCTTYRPTTAPGRTGYELDTEGKPIILDRGGQCVSNMAGEIVGPEHGPRPLRGDGARAGAHASSRHPACSPPAATRTGSRRRRSRAARTGTPGSRRARPATTPSSCTRASPPRGRRPASSARATSRARTRTTSARSIGRVMKARVYYPSQGGLPYNGTDGAGYAGTKLDGPISRPWVSLDEPAGRRRRHRRRARQPRRHVHDPARPARRLHGLDLGRAAQRDHRQLQPDRPARTRPPTSATRCSSGWFAEMSGTVFNDLNENGRQDPGEPGIPGFPVTIKTPQQLDRGSGLADLPDRHRRPLQPRPGLPAQPVQRARGLRRRLEDDRRHLPGRQPADADDRARRRRRRQLPAHHRPLRAPRLGRQALRRR